MFFRRSQKRLGAGSALGVQFYMLDRTGAVIASEAYNPDMLLPMASTKKVAIALAVLKRVFLDKNLTLNTIVPISHQQFSPGRPTNSLDRYFFMPWQISDRRTVDQLLTYMLTESDNSSTDVLLALAGGVEEVNALVRSLDITGHRLSWSSRQLLSHYYGVPTNKSCINIYNILKEFWTAYSLRPTESVIVHAAEDACTPKMMAHLLQLLVSERVTRTRWLADAADVIFDKMQHCLTGNTVIKAGASAWMPTMSAFGSKQGGLGGIRNDSAFIQFHDGRWAILSIHTCLTALPLAARDEIIANLTKSLLSKHLHLAVTFRHADESTQDAPSRRLSLA